MASLRPHLPYVGAVLLVALLAGLPLFQMKMMSGHDAPEYLTRAVEFYQGLHAGQIFPRWAPDLNFGYGEPFFSFNPPLIYYLMALFRALGASFVAARTWHASCCSAQAGWGCTCWAAELFGKRGGLVAAAAYLFAPYMLAALYVRQALADFSAFASIPFAFWGIYRYARIGAIASCWPARRSGPAHAEQQPGRLMAGPALVAWAGWLGWQERSWRTLLAGLVPIGLGLASPRSSGCRCWPSGS